MRVFTSFFTSPAGSGLSAGNRIVPLARSYPQVTVKAAEEAAAQAPLQVQNASQLRDLAASAARIFGWDNKDKPSVQLNQLCISQEMIDKIRAAAEDPYKKPITEGDAT
jgi:hypothetical protein